MSIRVGVDGCKAGWVAVVRAAGEEPRVRIFRSFSELVDTMPADAVVAVDMPIGLPDRAGQGGRGPEAIVRRHLGQRQSSVFSIPSRAAVHAEPGPFDGVDAWYAAHRRASAIARATSDPPRGCSIQAFGIFAKVRELDTLLLARPHLRSRLIESHPEVVFWRLNGGEAMTRPKKIKGRVNPEGMKERRALLARSGLPRLFLDMPPPRGAGADDVLDACAMLLVAERRAAGLAIPFPDPPLTDAHGIPIAIWT
jgi:predicted RNase H-like nuclease